jgi:hypothetical protein
MLEYCRLMKHRCSSDAPGASAAAARAGLCPGRRGTGPKFGDARCSDAPQGISEAQKAEILEPPASALVRGE